MGDNIKIIYLRSFFHLCQFRLQKCSSLSGNLNGGIIRYQFLKKFQCWYVNIQIFASFLINDYSHVIVCLFKIGVDFDGLSVAFDRLLFFTYTVECNAKIIVCICKIGVDFDGLSVALNCLFVPFGFFVIDSFVKVLFCILFVGFFFN